MVTTTALRVLVVDDYPDTARSLGILLGMWGHEAHNVASGLAALEVCKTWVPDVVLLDIGLPGLDGYAVARSLRAMPALAETLIIAVSGYATEHVRRAAAEAGFHCHLAKPIDPLFLEQVLGDIAERRAARRPLCP